MELERISLPLTIAGLAILGTASALIWLMLYEPVALAGAVEYGEVSLIAEALGRALLTGLQAIVRYF